MGGRHCENVFLTYAYKTPDFSSVSASPLYVLSHVSIYEVKMTMSTSECCEDLTTKSFWTDSRIIDCCVEVWECRWLRCSLCSGVLEGDTGRPAIVGHSLNLSAQQPEAGRFLCSWGYPGLHNESLVQNNKFFFKKVMSKSFFFFKIFALGVVAHAINPRIQETETMSSMLVWSTKWIPGQLEIHVKSKKIVCVCKEEAMCLKVSCVKYCRIHMLESIMH